jgi:hypothetical protein
MPSPLDHRVGGGKEYWGYFEAERSNGLAFKQQVESLGYARNSRRRMSSF